MSNHPVPASSRDAAEPKEPDVVPLDDPNVPESLVPIPAGLTRDAAEGPQETDYKALYVDLMYQVACVHPGESRHETAKRYIRQAEASHGPAMSANAVDPHDRKTHV